MIDHFDFLHGDNHQWKVTCETTSFRWMWPVAHFIQSGKRIFWLVIKLEKTIDIFNFLHGDNHQRIAFKTATLWAKQVPRFFDHQDLLREIFFVWWFSIFFNYFLAFLSNMMGVHSVLTYYNVTCFLNSIFEKFYVCMEVCTCNSKPQMLKPEFISYIR